MEKGKISVQTENIFPIIKKFLYSEHEIFIRELVSNAVDASQKMKKLAASGEYEDELGNLQVTVKLDETAKTITISDNGIGMTKAEVDKYINQVAFSSAEEFIEKFKNVDGGINIIGHFGLGFYSAFMVAKRVDIITKSYQKGAEAVIWTCDGSPEFEMDKYDKKERGTDIVLHIADDSTEFLSEHRIYELLNKFCKFLPIEVVFGETEETLHEGEKEVKVKKPRIINNTSPAWAKSPTDLKDEDYLAFYRELYPFAEEPLFWIHLNVDYPFNLTGILYFPKLKNNFEVQKNKIQLYSNQVFVTDNVEGIVPEFLMLLHGVIDSPDIPLNVSRSYLQADGNVKKITSHISKKVADKLAELFKNDRKAYEQKWDNIGLFVKYGIISDEKFYERAKDFALLKNLDAEYFTTEEYKEKIKALQTDKNERITCIYTTDKEQQDAYISAAKRKAYDVLEMDVLIDQHFVNHLEQKDDKLHFVRVDANTADKLIEKDETLESVLSKEQEEKVLSIFKESINDDSVDIENKALGAEDYPVQIVKNEFMRRMKDMSAMGGGFGNFPERVNLVINTNSPVIAKLLRVRKKEEMSKQLYDLALLQQGMLKGAKLTDFINRSVEVLSGD